jgi:hypothetical protein
MHRLIRMLFQLIGDLQAADRRAWERKVLGTIPRPAVVQYAPISLLPARVCTVSHCHTVLQGHYPYRRCERHRLQNRHHSKLKRVRDKEVKSTPLRSETTQDPESVESGRNKTRAVESSYPNEDRNSDSFAFETEGGGMSEVCLPLSILSIPTMVPTSRTTKSTRALSHLLLVAAVVQILFAPSSGARMYSIIAHRGRCATLIGRKIA